MKDGDAGRRWAAFAVPAAALLIVSALTGLFLSTPGTPYGAMTAHGALFVLGLLTWVTALQAPARHRSLIVLAVAVVVRLGLLPYPASDDMNRYLWEGRLVLAGESPYASVAAVVDPVWRDEIWAAINNRDKLTVYPPLVQYVFAAAAAIALDPLPLKLVLIAAEVATLLLVREELARRRLSDGYLALVAFNPVMLFATAAEGHFDALFVLATLLAIRARGRGSARAAWIWLGIAIQIKLVAVAFVVLFLRRHGWRTAWVMVPVVLLPCLPFLEDLPNLIRGVAQFGGTTAHNGFIHGILWRALGDHTAAAWFTYGAFALWIGFVSWRVTDPWRGAFLILGGLLLLAPIVHPWYLTWILPFLAISPQPAWLLLTGLQAFSFATWADYRVTGAWVQPTWAWAAQWLPFGLLFVATAWTAGRRLARPEPSWPQPRSVTAIVPAFNEGERIEALVRALRQQGPALSEVIVVDGGSSDDTAARAEAAGARVLSGPRGRGCQIAAGVDHARGDVIWLVHADTTPPPHGASSILAALAAAPRAAGGALGQRFARTTALFLLIEGLNLLRSAFFGISFGDQGQFVRRAALKAMGGFPPLPLMEDVELSLRLRRLGPVLHLGLNGIVSTRRWDRGSPAGRIADVVRLTSAYLLSWRRAALSEDQFRKYYPAGPE
jgi:rSAM/selenodomain-associated transferase 2